MAKKFRTLTGATLSPTQRARAAAMAQEMVVAEMPLHELRQARALTQAALAESLNVAQPEVSRIEKRTDMYIGTLRRYIEAMGGQLEIIARFPDGAVKINQFEMVAG